MDWKATLIPYEQAVEELKIKFKSIRNEYRKLDEYSPIEFVTGRVKSISSIINKANLRGVQLEEIEAQIEDIAGIRIMCQFEEDIYRVVELLRARNGMDFQIEEERDYIVNQKSSGYRSYHVIVRYPVVTAYGQRIILAEIQIRTLAMNFWATIEHSLNYKFQGDLPEHMRNRLRKAADAAIALDAEMSDIRDEIMNAQQAFQERSNLARDILELLSNLNSSENQEAIEKLNKKFICLNKDGNLEGMKALLKELRAYGRKE